MRISFLALAMATAVRVVAAQDPGPAQQGPVRGAAPECHAATGAAADTLCLSRAEAIARAATANPNLQVASALAAQARARKVEATAIPDPAFGAEWDESRGVFGQGGASSRPVGATLTIPFFDKFRLQGKIGAADVHSAEADSMQTAQSIASLTSQVYDGLLAALRRRADLLEIKALADTFVVRTQGRYDAGTAAKLDVIKAQVDAAQAGNDLIAADRDVLTSRASLNRLIGRPLDAGIATSDTLTVPPALPDLAPLIASALRDRPEIRSLASQQMGARAATSLAKEFWLPDLTVGIGRDYADPGPGVLTTGISLPIPLFYWQHAKGEIAEAQGHERELEATRRDLIASVGEEVRSIYAAADAAIRQAAFLRDQLLPSAREAYRIAAASYALGGSSALEVLDARRSLLDAESQYTDALVAANASRADLERAVATPLASFGAGASR